MLRLIHNQTVSGSILVNDIDDGLPNKAARREVAREKVSGIPVLVAGGISDPANSRLDGSSLGGRDKSTLPGVNSPKQKCYIPRYKLLSNGTHDTSIAGYIDVVESDRVLISQNRGVIYGLSQFGDLAGIGDLTFSTPTVTVTDAGAVFLATDIGKYVEITGATNPTNNGSFLITAVPTPTTFRYSNALGVAETGVNYEVVRGTSLITVVSFAAADVAPPRLTSAVIDSGGVGYLTINGTGLTSLEPDLTRVTITGATIVTLTQSQIVAAGGSLSPTAIVIPPALLPVVTVGTSSVTVVADNQTLSANLLSLTGWTSTGWTGSFNAYKHTAGNTTALTNTLAAVVGVGYLISFTITGNTGGGTITPTFGGVTGAAISSTPAVPTLYTATTTGSLSILPTSPFNGTIQVSIRTLGAMLTSTAAPPVVTTAVLRRGTTGTTSLTFSTPTVTLVDTAATFLAGDVGKSIRISGAATPGNNGTFVIASVPVPGGTSLTYTNAGGATEAAAYTLELGITGTALASVAPDTTSVIVSGTGAVTLTEAQITTAGGTVGATSIIVPITLIPSVVLTASLVVVKAHNQLSTPAVAVT
jgi:hypothetical protein